MLLLALLFAVCCWRRCVVSAQNNDLHVGSDVYPHPPNTIRIEIAGIKYGSYSDEDFRVRTGALLWRDYVNNKEGGICLGGGPSWGQCTEGKRQKVNLVIWQLGKLGYDENISQDIRDWGLEIQKRTVDQIPHFIFCSVGLEYAQACNYILSITNGLSTPQGLNLITMTGSYSLPFLCAVSPSIHSGLPQIFEKEYEFPFSAWTSHYQSINTMGLQLSTLYNVTSIGLLSDEDASEDFWTMIDLLGKQLTASNIFVLKMCSSDKYNPDGRNCTNDLQCRDEESCVYPAVKRDLFNDPVLESERLTKKWIERFIRLGMDGFFYAAETDVFSAMNYMRILQWTPKFAGGVNMRYVFYQGLGFGAVMDNWHIVSTYDEKIDFGIKNQYMGTTSDYIEYVEANFRKYMDPNVYERGTNDLEHDYEYISVGSADGVIVQRLLELATTYYGIEVKDASFHTSDVFENLRGILINNFGLCYDYRGDPTPNHCGTTPCPRSDYTCGFWSNFHGNVKHDISGINSASTGYVGQIQPNESSYTYNLNFPHILSQCHLNNSKCSLDMNYTDCSCSREYPAQWMWKPVFINVSLDVGQNPAYIVNEVFHLLVAIATTVMSLVTDRKMGRTTFALWPKAFRYHIYSYSISTLGIMFLFLKPTPFICNAYIVVYDTFALISVFSLKQALFSFLGSSSAGPNIAHLIIATTASTAVSVLCNQLFSDLTTPIVTVYEGVKPFNYRYCHYNTSSVIAPFANIVFAPIFIIITLYISSFRRNSFLLFVMLPTLYDLSDRAFVLVAFPLFPRCYFFLMNLFPVLYRTNIKFDSFNNILTVQLVHAFYGVVQIVLMILQIYVFPSKEGTKLLRMRKVTPKITAKFLTSIENPLYRVFFQVFLNSQGQGSFMKYYEAKESYLRSTDKEERSKLGKQIIVQFLRSGGPYYLGTLPNERLKTLAAAIGAAEQQDNEVIQASGMFNQVQESILRYLCFNGYYKAFKSSKQYSDFVHYNLIEAILKRHTIAVSHGFQEEIEYLINENKPMSDSGDCFVSKMRRYVVPKTNPTRAQLGGAQEDLKPLLGVLNMNVKA